MLVVSIGSKWKCVDEDFMEYGEYATVIDADNNPDFNGEQDIEIQFEDGSTMFMKKRRFEFRYKRVNE